MAGWKTWLWEIRGIVVLTVLRLVWILKRAVPQRHNVLYLPGLSNLRKPLRYDPNFSYVPYGLIWYAINVPIVRAVRYSGRLWITVLALIDIVFLWYSQVLGLTVFIAYVFIGPFQLLRAPWNASINWLIVLAPDSWVFLILAPIAKFPIGLPIQVLRYTERAVGHQHNYIYFGLLVTLWLIVFSHLYFLPGLDSFAVLGFGAIWGVILGYAFVERKHGRD